MHDLLHEEVFTPAPGLRVRTVPEASSILESAHVATSEAQGLGSPVGAGFTPVLLREERSNWSTCQGHPHLKVHALRVIGCTR